MSFKSNKTKRKFTWFFIVLMTLQLFTPLQSFALTGGPSQPEVESFSPIGTSEMVDVSTGDFRYNIPLFEIGGYPINLNYNAGISMDQEASMVGLGWNLSVGMIKRTTRVLPDDFGGDVVEKEFYMKPNVTWGGSVGVKGELFGADLASLALKATLGLSHNNYYGLDLEFGLAPSLTAGSKNAGYLSAGLGINASARQGIGLSPQLSYSHAIMGNDLKSTDLGLSVGASIHSRQGLRAMTLGPTLGISGYADKKKGRSLASPSSSYSFVKPTYTPSFQFPMINKSFTFMASVGGAAFGSHPGGSLSGYHTRQELFINQMSVPAYGSLYAHVGQDVDGLMDFNREKEGSFTIDVPNLPIPIFGQDVYGVSGQGVGGSYQLKRADVGLLYDKSVTNFSGGSSIGGEVGAPAIAHFGADGHFTSTTASSGKWTDNFPILDRLKFKGTEPNVLSYESSYFKRAGEQVSERIVDSGYKSLFDHIGGFEAVRVKLNSNPSSGLEVKPETTLVRAGGSDVTTVGVQLQRPDREKRTQSITYLTAIEAKKFGLQTEIENHAFGTLFNPQTIDRDDYPGHHISEITVLRPDGLRYVYGNPVYNTKQSEVSFSINPNQTTQDCSEGLTSYAHGQDNAPENGNGLDEYYSATHTPEFAHSYLLSAVLSEDYVDLTGDGPTVDDYGSYTKFNYHKLGYDYKWRIPYDDANYNPGYQSNPLDDKANYLYGEKEISLIHSIESKNQVAEFIYSDRHDSHGVNDEEGGRDNNMDLKKLDAIRLYTIPNRKTANPIPIKTAHFTYNYSLCPEVPNNDQKSEFVDGIDLNINHGKLTLESVYFTHGESHKGRLSPYVFEYNGPNPKYFIKAYNRWGTFQPVLPFCTASDLTDASCVPSGNNCVLPTAEVTTADFPYVPQDDRTRQDQCAAAWNLTDIHTPSGAHIKVEYEADDYGYVQDKPAMQMFPIAATSPTVNPTSLTSDKLYTGGANPTNHQYLFFKLQDGLPISQYTLNDAKKAIQAHYLKDIFPTGWLYFKMLVDLDGQNHYEYVPGYVPIEDWGVYAVPTAGEYTHGFIKIGPACSGDRDPFPLANSCPSGNTIMNPITKAAGQFARLNLPKLAYGQPQPDWNENDTNHEDILVGLLTSVFGQIKQAADGFNKQLLANGFGQTIVKEKSYIRLYNPYQNKIAGTHRVSQITLEDNWEDMTGAPNQTSMYGQTYDYTDQKKIDGESYDVSTGVAAYEPILGGEENPFRQPVVYKQELLLAPDNKHYQETPLMESLFPAPTIIYSEVKVRNLAYSNATGYTVHKFYTAKDFPVKVSTTGVDPKPKKTNPILKILKIKNEEHMTASQGYAIELNDMHGKQRSQYVYDEFDTKVSGVHYRYHTKSAGSLDNEVDVILPDGTLEKRRVGVDYQMVGDARESSNEVESGGVNINNDNFMVTIFPALTVVPLPSYSTEKTRFRSLVLNKVINRYGILEKTTAFDQGSSVETRNIAYDSETGEPLLTRTYNEFDNEIHNLTIPAHWAYEGMQAAYQNVHARFSGFTYNTANPGEANTPYAAFFTPGDEVAIDDTDKAWVLDVDTTNNNNNIFLIDENGNGITSGNQLKILRSGHRNKQATPIGALTSLKPPLTVGGENLELDVYKDVLEASAVEFSEKWQTPCIQDTCWFGLTEYANQAEGMINYFIQSGVIGANASTMPDILSLNLLPDFPNLFSANGCDLSSCNPIEFINKDFGSNHSITLRLRCNKVEILPSTGCNCDFIFEIDQGDGLPSSYSLLNIESVKFDYSSTFNNNNTYAVLTGYWDSGTVTRQIKVDRSNCFLNTKECLPDYCGPLPGDIVNPYQLNLRGVWRPEKNWSYLTSRNQSAASSRTNTNIETDGTFNQFTPFWKGPDVNHPLWWDNNNDWVWSTEITKFHPNGNELENRDTLDRYSAELLGYGSQMVTAVAANANYNQIAFDGFEDYEYEKGLLNQVSCPSIKHFGFDHQLNTTGGHTGKYSLSLLLGTSTSTEYPIETCMLEPEEPMEEYELKPCDCLGRFSPTPGKYIFSAWVKENRPANHFDYVEANVDIQVGGASYNFKASGEIIEGWQRIYGEFDIATNADFINIQLNAAPDAQTWYDDLRIHPYDASFKTYVYDDIDLRFTYELDENNYFTKYEYDKAGRLERVKKETERGIMTIQESYFSPPKNILLK